MADHVCAEQVHWHLKLQHFGDTNIKYLEVRGACKSCGRAVTFRGPAGVNPAHPTVAIDGAEAVFPFLFEGEEYDGKGVSLSISIPGGN